jgi:hypothetical protein
VQPEDRLHLISGHVLGLALSCVEAVERQLAYGMTGSAVHLFAALAELEPEKSLNTRRCRWRVAVGD